MLVIFNSLNLTKESEYSIIEGKEGYAMYKRLKRKVLKRLNGILGKKKIA